MKLPLSWIKDYIELEMPAERIAEDLLLTGTKVESFEKSGNDFIFDFEITPNRPDCLSVLGIARELAAIYNKKLVLPSVFSSRVLTEKLKIKISAKSSHLCPYFTFGIIDNIKVGPSPDWIKQRLEKSGVRSLNNVVDITNYVMLETGQPMHAFDFDKLEGDLKIRSSQEGETIATIDGIIRKLPTGAIIIEDKKKIIDLAGLMGGQNSQVDSETDTILLHVPVYDPLAIRLTSQKLGFRTEASNRFEKNLDPNAHRYAFERALKLLEEFAQGSLASKIESINYPKIGQPIKIGKDLIDNYLGINLPPRKIEEILNRLEFAASYKTSGGKTVLEVEVPSFRTDIKGGVDLIEEIARIYGYANLPKSLPKGEIPKNPFFGNNEIEIKEYLARLGLKEVYCPTLTSGQILDNLGIKPEETLRVANRLVIDYEYLRPTLLTGLINVVKINAEKTKRGSFFEIARIFTNVMENSLPCQPKMVGLIFYGYSYSEAKGVLEKFLQHLNIGTVSFNDSTNPEAYFQLKIDLSAAGINFGCFGQIKSAPLEKFSISDRVFFAQLSLEDLLQLKTDPVFKPPLKYPTVKEKFSMFIPENVRFTDIAGSIYNTAKKNIYSLKLEEDTFIKGKRSILISVEYFSPTHTLEKSEIDKIRQSIEEALLKLNIEIRKL